MERILPSKSKLCRLCLTESVVYYSLFEKERAVFLEALTSIKIDEDESLPTYACIRCCLCLKYAFQIQQTILEADRKLHLLDFNLLESDIPTEVNFSKDEEETTEIYEQNCFKNNSQKRKRSVEIDLNDFHHLKFDKETKIENVDVDEVLVIKTEGVSEQNPVDFIEDTPFDDIIKDQTIHNTSEDKSLSPCRICGLEFPLKDLMEHIGFHYFSTVKCDDCNMPCENINTYRLHLQEEHKDTTPNKCWACKTCKTSFFYKPLYIIHFRSAHLARPKSPLPQTDGNYPCSYCKKQFYTEKKRDAHMVVHKRKQCDICGASITPTNFPAHRKSHLEAAVECPICGRKYKNTVSLKGHIHYTHSQRTYKCEFCDKIFKKSYTLLLHIKREHTGEKSHVCDLCGKSFLTFYNLSKHKKMTHQKLRPFQCECCQKKFSSKFALRTHERQHTLDAPFDCDLCGLGFRQKVSLKSHKKSVHKVEEPLTCACEVCGKWFSSKFAVMSHMRLH